MTWTNAGSITPKSLYAAGHNGAGLLLAAGVEGAILRSQITPLTNEIEIVQYSRGQNQSTFLFAGVTGQRFTLDRSVQITNWIAGELLEFLDGSGTLLYLEPNDPKPPPEEFYRATQVPYLAMRNRRNSKKPPQKGERKRQNDGGQNHGKGTPRRF
jgi:hypothetical protein